MSGLWSDIKVPPMSKRERDDLEREAGRKFLSDSQAHAYRKRQLNSWLDSRPARAERKKRKAAA
jgi:hypothetical protein